ncbi:MerR family transcriptional regulator [Nonomuraea sp. NPDC050663]|uniref:MerR family transcriptional regulator n=1 Tax=Nonomuraea sp. NPDC050663 TaxID=3364370 RepID=UPI00379E6A14
MDSPGRPPLTGQGLDGGRPTSPRQLYLVVPSACSRGGFRLYTESDVARLMVVRRLKPLGFSVEQMRGRMEIVERLDVAPGPWRAGARRSAIRAVKEPQRGVGGRWIHGGGRQVTWLVGRRAGARAGSTRRGAKPSLAAGATAPRGAAFGPWAGSPSHVRRFERPRRGTGRAARGNRPSRAGEPAVPGGGPHPSRVRA